MALVKFVCQGCGANLDAQDDQRIFECGYCGTSNRIQKTVAPQQSQPAYTPQPLPIKARPQAQQSSGGSKAVLIIVLAAVLLPVGLGGFITYMVFSKVSSTVDKTLEQVADATGRTLSGVTGAGVLGSKLLWASQRPFLADVDGDGTDDIIALAQPLGGSVLQLVALSGQSQAKLWTAELGERSNLPQARLSIVPEHKLALVPVGASLRAYGLDDGGQRWIASLPDKIQSVARGEQGLIVTTVDDAVSLVALSSGQVSEADSEAADAATSLRDDEGYELIPSHSELDLQRGQFDKLRVERGFCPAAELDIKNHRQAACTAEHGLAFATRAKGTKVPFLIGYDPRDKSERWRVQLTEAGSLETVGSGFEQPRAEFVGGDAIVSFAPDKHDGARIRRLDLRTGETKWETTLASERNAHVNGMVVGDALVVVNFGQAMVLLSLADGKVNAKIGGL